MLSADDAQDLRVPLGLYISNNEPEQEVRPPLCTLFTVTLTIPHLKAVKITEILSKKPFSSKCDYKLYDS